LFGIHHHPQAHLTALPANRAPNRRRVIGKRATSSSFVRPTARRVHSVEVFAPFFPPHSDTFHRFQKPYRLRGCRVAGVLHWPAHDDATSKPSCRPSSIRAPVAHWIALVENRAATTPPAGGSTGCLQTACHYTDGKSPGKRDSDTRVVRSPHSPGNSAPHSRPPDNAGSAIRLDESTSSATRYSTLRPGGL